MEGGGYYGLSGKRAHNNEGNAGERNGKQKKRLSYIDDQATQVEETEYRILCPINRIGSLIGKGGSIIKALRTECRSKIKVEDPVLGSDERVIIISSSSDQIAEQAYYACAAQEALFKVHARITEADYDDQFPQPVNFRLLVPKVHIGCLLGKAGKIIEQMRKDIGVQIRILPKDQHPACAASTDELVQVAGDAFLVRKALFEISTRLHDNLTGERMQRDPYMPEGHGRFAVPMFPGGGGVYHSGGYLQMGSLLAPSSGYSYGGVYGDVNATNAWGLSSPSSATGAVTRPVGASEEEFILRVLCPNSRTGSIIGKGGVIINKMRETTGAKIKVEEQVPDSEERVIIVSAAEFADTYPSPTIEAVIQVFRRLAEMQMDKDVDNKSFSLRLLVPSNQIGCLLGKGGSIVTEMRKLTKANIRISPKDEPCKCAEENDELVQIMGDQSVVHDALVQILNRLRSNLFKGQEGRDTGPGLGLPVYAGAAYAGSNLFNSYKAGPDSGSAGTTYLGMNVGYHNSDYGFGGISSINRDGKDSGRRQR
ncbi:hypothetical protein GOP47_0023334 [Adiantum capillus-veneris]|uniref:K Homology domain-containing protein n=1 Tax=Adiantum capillus-veneris TaxID=13818 RepID=A0A9D4U3A7_ADICA|nr:hypothetical protein GOP47_0023334 [Adiantum capillus-veneris]